MQFVNYRSLGPDMDQAPYCLAVGAVSRPSEPDGKGQAKGQVRNARGEPPETRHP